MRDEFIKRFLQIYPYDNNYQSILKTYGPQNPLFKMLKNNKTVSLKYNLTINGDILPYMNQLNQMEIFRVIDNYVGDLIDNPNDKYGDFVDNLCNYTVENCFGEKINDLTIADLTPVSNIKKTLNSVFNSHSRLSFNERWKLLTNLSKNKFFQQFGSGILTRLAMFASQKSRQEFHNLFYVEIETNSREFSQPRKAHFGGYKDRNSFSEMLNLRNRVLNRNYNVEYFD